MTATRIASPTPLELDIRDFFKTALFSNKDDEFIFDVLDCLAEGYCIDQGVLTKFQEWHRDRYPTLKTCASLQNNEWIVNINIGVGRINEFIKKRGNFSQGHLNKQFIRFLKKYPVPSAEKYIKNLEEGHCSGYGFFVTNLLRLEFLPHKPGAQVDNWSSLLSVFSTLSLWDGASDLLASRPAIMAMFYSVYQAQHALSTSGVDQCEWENLYSDSAHRQVVRVDASLGTALNETNVAAVLNESFLKASEAVSSSWFLPKGRGELVALSFRGYRHNTTLSKAILDTGGVYLIHYDSNNLMGPITVGKEIAAKVVRLGHEYFKESTVEPFSVEAFAFANAEAIKGLQFALPVDAELKRQSEATITLMSFRACRSLPLIKQGTLLDYTGLGQKMSLFHSAARRDRKEFAQKILEHKDVKATELINVVTATSGRTALHIASRWGHDRFVKLLLEQKADSGIKTKSTDKKFPGSLAVQTAVRFGHVDVVRMLIDRNPGQLRVVTDQDESLLHLAVQGNWADVVDYLLEKFRENRLDITTPLKGKPLLDLTTSPWIKKQILAAQLPDAIKRKEPAELAYLVKQAVVLGELTALTALLDAGMDVNGIYDGGTLVHSATKADQLEVVNVLLQRGASLVADEKQLPVVVAKEPLRRQLGQATLMELLTKHPESPDLLVKVQKVLSVCRAEYFCTLPYKEAEMLVLETLRLQNSALLGVLLKFFGTYYTERILNQSSVLDEMVQLSNAAKSDEAATKRCLECALLLFQFGAQEKRNKDGQLLGDVALRPEIKALFVKARFLQGLNNLHAKKKQKKRSLFQSSTPKSLDIVSDVKAVLSKMRDSSTLELRHFKKLQKHLPEELKAAQACSLIPAMSAVGLGKKGVL